MIKTRYYALILLFESNLLAIALTIKINNYLNSDPQAFHTTRVLYGILYLK